MRLHIIVNTATEIDLKQLTSVQKVTEDFFPTEAFSVESIVVAVNLHIHEKQLSHGQRQYLDHLHERGKIISYQLYSDEGLQIPLED